MAHVDPIAGIAREADPSFSFVHPHSHYDGVYFYAIARDPFARGEAHRLIDRPAYRYGHPGYGWLAWIASLGRPEAVPAALLVIGLAGAGAAAFAASMIARDSGRSPWWGLVVAFSPGIVYSVTADLSEPIGIAAVLLGMLAWSRHRWAWAGVAFAAACLIKEPFILVPVGLAAWEVLRLARGMRRADLGARIISLAIGPILFGLWYLYVTERFGILPFREGQDLLSAPFVGWIDTFERAAKLGVDSFDRSQIGGASIAMLAVVGAMLIAGSIQALRLRSFLDPVFLFFALFASMMGWLQLLYPKDMMRELAVHLVLLPAVLSGPGLLREATDGSKGGRLDSSI